ncbi:MAG: radical SAM protein, partial [Promicromonosporaceae bacterium]|nr:radical SAM protein [Promicromonosporaceae bacterium]
MTFSVYLHVPFCAARCGYCDFNTYTAPELGGGASQLAYADTALQEVAAAGRFLRERPPLSPAEERSAGSRLETQNPSTSRNQGQPPPPVDTVFFGGGTPTLLPAGDLLRLLDGVRNTWGLAPGAEVTTEANPDSVDAEYLAALAAGGFTRVSIGMQSAVPHVLRTLERTHNPERVPQVVRWARDV